MLFSLISISFICFIVIFILFKNNIKTHKDTMTTNNALTKPSKIFSTINQLILNADYLGRVTSALESSDIDLLKNKGKLIEYVYSSEQQSTLMVDEENTIFKYTKVMIPLGNN